MKIQDIGESIAGAFGMLIFGGIFFFILIGVLLLIIAAIGVMFFGAVSIIGATHYTVTEFIPYKNLPECASLNLTDEFVWNSPREVPEGLNILRCHGDVYYSSGGKPLFYMGDFSPPDDFPIREIEWGFFGKLKSISFEDSGRII